MGNSSAAARAIVATNLRLLMDRRRWVQKEVEAKSGVSQRKVSSILKQQQDLTTEILAKLGHAFGIPGWLLMVPGFSTDSVGLLDSDKITSLVDLYIQAGPEGRDVIDYWANHEAHHSPERQKIVALRKKPSV